MKFLIKSYPKTFEKTYVISGYGNSPPYLTCGAPYEDNIGTQHIKLYIPKSQECHEEVKGKTVCMAHVPANYRMITKHEYEEYLTLKRKFGKYNKSYCYS